MSASREQMANVILSQPQRTIAREGVYTGVGLHTGENSTVTFKGAHPDTGVRFVYTGKGMPATIEASAPLAISEPRRTTLEKGSCKIHTVEHLLAAVCGLGIDNLEMEINGSEVPEIDGSSLPYVNLLKGCGIVGQKKSKRYCRVEEPIYVSEGGAFILVVPADEFRVSFTLDYASRGVVQYASFQVDEETFERQIAPSRTFCFQDEAKGLQEEGLGKGANFDNTVVIGSGKEHLRFKDEFVRHKVLDVIGDLSLVGSPLKAHVIAVRSGHNLNIKLAGIIRERLKPRAAVGGQEGILDTRDIQEILPHRYPFLFVDKIIELKEDKEVVGIKNVTINEGFFAGHFPQRPIMPGVIIVEAMAQTAGVLMLRKEENRGKLAFVMGFDKVRFRKPVVPGDQLRLEARVYKLRTKTGKVMARALVEGKVVAEAEFMFSVVEP